MTRIMTPRMCRLMMRPTVPPSRLPRGLHLLPPVPMPTVKPVLIILVVGGLVAIVVLVGIVLLRDHAVGVFLTGTAVSVCDVITVSV
jgi:hypothetical protein